MNRRLLNLLTALSLLLCVATCALWVRGHYVVDEVMRRYSPDGRLTSKWDLCSDRGHVSFSSAVEPDNPSDAEFYYPGPAKWWWEKWPHETLREGQLERIPPANIEPAAGFWGFGWHWDWEAQDDGNGYRYRWRAIRFPLWLPAVVFASTPVAAAWRRYVRRARSRRGLCPTCNYNLTGNTSGVCPECGQST